MGLDADHRNLAYKVLGLFEFWYITSTVIIHLDDRLCLSFYNKDERSDGSDFELSARLGKCQPSPCYTHSIQQVENTLCLSHNEPK